MKWEKEMRRVVNELFEKFINNVPKTPVCAITSPFMYYMPAQKEDCESTFESNSILNVCQGNLKK